jgi:ketosteroid isomerase-like protein
MIQAARGAAVGLLLGLVASTLAAQRPSIDERAVVAAVQDFFAALKAKDGARLAAAMDSTARFTLLRPAAGGARVMVLTGAQFTGFVTEPNRPPIDERIRNPEVRVDGDLATVWAPYQVVTNGNVSHCGTDAIHLARLGGSWKIVNVADTFRQQGCGKVWE